MPKKGKKNINKAPADDLEISGRKTTRTNETNDSTEARGKGVETTENELVFEDPFGDEFEEEEIDQDCIVEEEYDEDGDGDGDRDGLDTIQEDEELRTPSAAVPNQPKQVWRPGVDAIDEGEALEYDPSAYVMYHSLRTEWPCLTFDILKDTLGR
jgi:ribosome assembly protein RRB1